MGDGEKWTILITFSLGTLFIVFRGLNTRSTRKDLIVPRFSAPSWSLRSEERNYFQCRKIIDLKWNGSGHKEIAIKTKKAIISVFIRREVLTSHVSFWIMYSKNFSFFWRRWEPISEISLMMAHIKNVLNWPVCAQESLLAWYGGQ